jgi:hypothetical protein
LFCFVSFRFVSFRFVSCHFISFCLAIHQAQSRSLVEAKANAEARENALMSQVRESRRTLNPKTLKP